MSKRTKWALPIVPDPVPHICYQIMVPDDREHIAAFLGAIYELSKPYAWEDDVSHTALITGRVWGKIFDQLIAGCEVAPAVSNGGVDTELMIRQNPTNPCILESSLDGTNWCQWADLSKCIANPPQPGSGAPQPPVNGGQACYQATMSASSLFLIPTKVTTGDVVTLSEANGSTNDPDRSATIWRCPDGEQFFAGACIGFNDYVSTDPLPTTPHMALIYKIGANYYPAMAGAFTVPGGVAQAQITVQVNDSAFNNDYGTLQFKVCVTNNQAAQWNHDLYFNTSPYHFVPYQPAGQSANAQYSPANGWIQVYYGITEPTDATRYTRCTIETSWATATTLTKVTMFWDETMGTGSSNGDDNSQYADSGGGFHALSSVAPATAAGRSLDWTGSVTAYGLVLGVCAFDKGPGGAGDGTARIYRLHVEGSGYDPFA